MKLRPVFKFGVSVLSRQRAAAKSMMRESVPFMGWVAFKATVERLRLNALVVVRFFHFSSLFDVDPSVVNLLSKSLVRKAFPDRFKKRGVVVAQGQSWRLKDVFFSSTFDGSVDTVSACVYVHRNFKSASSVI